MAGQYVNKIASQKANDEIIINDVDSGIIIETEYQQLSSVEIAQATVSPESSDSGSGPEQVEDAAVEVN